MTIYRSAFNFKSTELGARIYCKLFTFAYIKHINNKLFRSVKQGKKIITLSNSLMKPWENLPLWSDFIAQAKLGFWHLTYELKFGYLYIELL